MNVFVFSPLLRPTLHSFFFLCQVRSLKKVLKIKIKCAAKGRLRVAHFKATAATKGDVEQTAKHMPQNVATVATATAKIDASHSMKN